MRLLFRAVGIAATLLAVGAIVVLTSCADRSADTPPPDDAHRAHPAPPGLPSPPPLPAPGTPDSLLGLVIVPSESLPRFETREHAYEEVSVAVYGRNEDWYLVGREDGGRAWFPVHLTGGFFPLEDLVLNGLNWLTEDWDRRLRVEPDPRAEASAVSGLTHREIPARVVEARRAAGTLWFRVEVLERSPCEGEPPLVAARGWIPAWGEGGRPTAWFYARGC